MSLIAQGGAGTVVKKTTRKTRETDAVERAEARERRTSRAAIKALQLNWLSEVTIGGAAFVLSLSIAGGSFIQFILGPEIDVLPPEQILFYRGGLPNRAVLYAAIRLPMVNKASAYNDVLVDATIQPIAGHPQLPFDSLVGPVFNDEEDPGLSKAHCAAGRRCHHFPKMAISELSDEVVVIAGGGAHANYYSFRLFCRGAEKGCSDYSSFDRALDALQARSRNVTINLTFYSDGIRTVTCPIGLFSAKHMRKVGWQSLPCEKPTVSAAPIL